MKTIQKIILFFLLALPIIGNAETKEIPFTLDDRELVSIFGFAFWDRKLSLAPLKKEDQRI
jgi:hypothetical protein